MVQGNTYLVEVGGYSSYYGTGVLTISCAPTLRLLQRPDGQCMDGVAGDNCLPPLRFAPNTVCATSSRRAMSAEEAAGIMRGELGELKPATIETVVEGCMVDDPVSHKKYVNAHRLFNAIRKIREKRGGNGSGRIRRGPDPIGATGRRLKVEG